MIYLLIFTLLALVVIKSGQKLSRYGDQLGELYNLEKSWVGIVLLASITSLPELITSSSATYFGNPEMAISNVFGSNMFNIFIIFLLDAFFIKKSFVSKIKIESCLSGLFSILLTLVFLLGFIFNSINLFGINIFSIGLLILYLVAMKILAKASKEELTDELLENEIINDDETAKDCTFVSPRKLKIKFFYNALITIVVGALMSIIADKIAVTPIFGVVYGRNFIGTILLALATSLPELIVSTESVKIGSYNMAAGNILGSNIFNLSIIFFVDLIYHKKNMYMKLNNFHMLSALFSIILLLIFIFGVFLKNKKNKYNSYLIGIVYIGAMYILYQGR